MPYTTVVAGTTITAAWGNTNVRDQVVTPFATAAARISAVTAPVEGMVSWQSDEKHLDVYSGTTHRMVAPHRQLQVLSSPAASVTFNGLPAGVKNITLRISARNDAASPTNTMFLRVNGDSAANYFGVISQVQNATVTGNNSASSTSAQIGIVSAASAAAQHYSETIVEITGWNRTDRFLHLLARSTVYAATANSWLWYAGYEYAVATTYSSLVISPGGGNFTTGSEFSLEAWD